MCVRRQNHFLLSVDGKGNWATLSLSCKKHHPSCISWASFRTHVPSCCRRSLQPPLSNIFLFLEELQEDIFELRHANKNMFNLSLVSCVLYGMLCWKPTFKARSTYFLFFIYFIILENLVISESGPFSVYIQPISLQIYLQPPSVTNHVPILYLTLW